eukprot:COSAG01_NODE_611_length_14848_cov_207.046308_13_plen_95_part_00
MGSCGLCPVHQYYGRTLCRQPEGSAWGGAGEPCPPVLSGTLGNGGVHDLAAICATLPRYRTYLTCILLGASCELDRMIRVVNLVNLLTAASRPF